MTAPVSTVASSSMERGLRRRLPPARRDIASAALVSRTFARISPITTFYDGTPQPVDKRGLRERPDQHSSAGRRSTGGVRVNGNELSCRGDTCGALLRL